VGTPALGILFTRMADRSPSERPDALEGFPVVVVVPVAWGEMDAYRHVNNVVYFRYFENARLEYFRRLDWFALEEETGVGPILHSTEARFRRPLTYPDTVSIGARVAAIGEDRFELEHVVWSHARSAVAATGKGLVVAFEYAAARKAPLPAALRRRIEELQAGPPPMMER
jgi:acyl-CoA thioester hydrolase